MRAPGDIVLHVLLGTALVVLARLYGRYRRSRGPVAHVGTPSSQLAVNALTLLECAAWGIIGAHTVNPNWFSWTEWPAPFIVRAIAVPAVIATLIMLSWVVGEAEPCYRAGGSERLETTGAYAIVRHPLYVAVVAVLASLTLLSASIVAAVITLATAVELLWRRAPREDRVLALRFGPEFDAYRARVPAFLRIGAGRR